MRKIRNCNASALNTGISKCPIDFSRIKGAIIVPEGTKLPADLTGDKLEELAHEDQGARAYGTPVFVEFAKNGGEAQTGSTGYGGVQVTGYSDRTDTFTLDAFYPEVMSGFVKNCNRKYGAYFYDDNNVIYGVNDGTEVLAPYAMNSIYADATPYRTSGAAATMNLCFAYSDAKEAFANFDYVQLDFNPRKYVLGLTAVELAKVGDGNKYKIVEKIGGYDLTALYGEAIASAASVISGATTTAITYSADDETLTIAASDGAVPKLKSPKVLYAAGIKGIEQA